MSVINSETKDVWQNLADEAGKRRPCPGRTVVVTGGKKYLNKTGVVVRHQRSKFGDTFRYGGEANLHMRDMQGRSGFCVLVRTDSGEEFWIDADKVEPTLQ